MKYANSRSFRRAVEDRLRNQSLQTGASLARLRKMVAFDRLLVRLVHDQSNAWVLKGGLALQLRLGNQARTTKDMDVLVAAPDDQPDDIHQALIRAALLDVGDWFRFEVERPARLPVEPLGGLRFHVYSLLDGRRFETFHVDVGWDDPLIEPAEILTTPPLLAFAGIPPTAVPCYPLTQQVAEKVHAYSRPRATGQSSRVKDLIDILLIAELGKMDGQLLRQALEATFEARTAHELPRSLADPPRSWTAPFRRLAHETELDVSSLPDAVAAARRFIDPILQREATGTWDPATWSWKPPLSPSAV